MIIGVEGLIFKQNLKFGFIIMCHQQCCFCFFFFLKFPGWKLKKKDLHLPNLDDFGVPAGIGLGGLLVRDLTRNYWV